MRDIINDTLLSERDLENLTLKRLHRATDENTCRDCTVRFCVNFIQDGGITVKGISGEEMRP